MDKQTGREGTPPAVPVQPSVSLSGPPQAPVPGPYGYAYPLGYPYPYPPYPVPPYAYMPPAPSPVPMVQTVPAASSVPVTTECASPVTESEDVAVTQSSSQEEDKPLETKFTCSCGKLHPHNSDALAHIATCHYGQIYLCPIVNCPTYRATLGQMQRHMTSQHSSLTTDWTAKQVDYHLDKARMTLKLHVDSWEKVVPPYATVSGGLIPPLDMCAFTGTVPRRPGTTQKSVQTLLKRPEVIEALSVLAAAFEQWPVLPRPDSQIQSVQLYRVPPDFQLGDRRPLTISTAQLVTASFTTHHGTPAMMGTPITRVARVNASPLALTHVTSSGRSTPMTSPRQTTRTGVTSNKRGRGTARGETRVPFRSAERESTPVPDHTILIPGADPTIVRMAADHFLRGWAGREPTAENKAALTAVQTVLSGKAYQIWKTSVVEYAKACAEVSTKSSTPSTTSRDTSEDSDLSPKRFRPAAKGRGTTLGELSRAGVRPSCEKVLQELRRKYSSKRFNEPMVAAWLGWIAGQLPMEMREMVRRRISYTRESDTILAFWETVEYLCRTESSHLVLAPELFKAPTGVPAPWLYQCDSDSSAGRNFVLSPGYAQLTTEQILTEYGLRPATSTAAVEHKSSCETSEEDWDIEIDDSPVLKTPFERERLRKVYQACIEEAWLHRISGSSSDLGEYVPVPPPGMVTTPTQTMEVDTPVVSAPIETKDAATSPVKWATPAAADAVSMDSRPLPASQTEGEPQDHSTEQSAFFYNCALPAVSPTVLRTVTTDVAGRFVLPRGLAVSFPMLPIATPECPQPQPLCGAFTLMASTPIHARLDFVPWQGSQRRNTQVMERLLQSTEMPPERDLTNHDAFLADIDRLIQCPGYESEDVVVEPWISSESDGTTSPSVAAGLIPEASGSAESLEDKQSPNDMTPTGSSTLSPPHDDIADLNDCSTPTDSRAPTPVPSDSFPENDL